MTEYPIDLVGLAIKNKIAELADRLDEVVEEEGWPMVARAAIEALREPSDAMLDSEARTLLLNDRMRYPTTRPKADVIADIYRAMINAASPLPRNPEHRHRHAQHRHREHGEVLVGRAHRLASFWSWTCRKTQAAATATDSTASPLESLASRCECSAWGSTRC